MSFNQFILKEQYKKVKGLGDRLELMKEQIAWKHFVPLVSKIFHDNEKEVGRPHTDELIIVRSMLLQGWYGLSDPELEFQCHDRLSRTLNNYYFYEIHSKFSKVLIARWCTLFRNSIQNFISPLLSFSL